MEIEVLRTSALVKRLLDHLRSRQLRNAGSKREMQDHLVGQTLIDGAVACQEVEKLITSFVRDVFGSQPYSGKSEVTTLRMFKHG